MTWVKVWNITVGIYWSKNSYGSNEIIKSFDLIPAPAGNIPSFIKTQNLSSQSVLYEKLYNSSIHGFACTKFVPAFNIYSKVIK